MSLPCAVPGAQGEAANAGVLGSERIDQGRSPYPHLFQETQNRSTMFIQELEVGMKCMWNRRCFFNQLTTFSCLCVQ